MKAIEIINLLNRWASPYLIDEWDNTGFQIGDGEKEVKKIIVSLDLDRKVFEKAVNEKAQMIITHHPIIFEPLKSITKLYYKEKLIYDLIKEDIVVYNAHTNLDLAEGGVNDALADILEIKNPEPLNIVCREPLRNEGKIYGYGRIGEIEETSLVNYLEIIKNRLDVDNLIVYGNINKTVKRVGVCGGSGASFIYDAYMKGADIYITGDIKYHEAQYANELGLTLIDGGHYHTEKVILPVIKEYLDRETSNVIEVEVYDQSSPPYVVY